MADKTTVLIGQQSGPHVIPAINYQAWAPAGRLREDGITTLPAFQPVYLDPDTGIGSVDVLPGLWKVAEFVPQNESPVHVWRVPASDEPVHFTDLVEETNTDLIGYGPTWAEQARIDAMRAVAAALEAAGSARAAEAWADIAEAAALLAGAPRYNVTSDGKTVTFEPSQYVTESADGKYLIISGTKISAGFRVPRLGANGLYRTDQLPLDAIVADVLEAMPGDLVENAMLAILERPESRLRTKLDLLYGGPGSTPEVIFHFDTDGTVYHEPRSD